MPRKAIDRAGQKFGMLTILSASPSIKNRPMSLCQCECGKIKIIQTNAIVHGGTKSCGCFVPVIKGNVTNISDKTYGFLTPIKQVLRPNNKKSTAAYWECLCNCGNIIITRADSLKNGYTRSCGCLKTMLFKDRHNKVSKIRQETKEYKMYTSAKHRAKKAGIPFTITLKDIVIPEYCPVLNTPIFTIDGELCPNAPSLDKFIPELGYTPGNITVISHKANTMKNNATLEEIQLLLNWMKGKI
jgi:hypothetical protein